MRQKVIAHSVSQQRLKIKAAKITVKVSCCFIDLEQCVMNTISSALFLCPAVIILHLINPISDLSLRGMVLIRFQNGGEPTVRSHLLIVCVCYERKSDVHSPEILVPLTPISCC